MARTRKRKPAESGETVARKIWLAGLGAYGKSVEDAHGQIDKASQEASKFFHDLVSKGQSIEDHSREALKERISEAKDRISEARERISEAAGSNTRTVEEMIGRVRERMGVDDAVHTRLDALARPRDRGLDTVPCPAVRPRQLVWRQSLPSRRAAGS